MNTVKLAITLLLLLQSFMAFSSSCDVTLIKVDELEELDEIVLVEAVLPLKKDKSVSIISYGFQTELKVTKAKPKKNIIDVKVFNANKQIIIDENCIIKGRDNSCDYPLNEYIDLSLNCEDS